MEQGRRLIRPTGEDRVIVCGNPGLFALKTESVKLHNTEAFQQSWVGTMAVQRDLY